MRIATINGMRNQNGGEFVDFQPFTFGEFQKVELTVRKDLDYFDTFDFRGFIDWCDSTPTQKITSRTVHSFSYPEGYQPEKETIDGEEITRHKVVLYFSERTDYGYIDGQLLSQVDVVRNPFPNFVFFNGYYSKYINGQTPPNVDIETERRVDVLFILNEDFKAPNGLTKNKESKPVFYTNIPKMNYYGQEFQGGEVVSTFKVMPKIYDELETNLSFPHTTNLTGYFRPDSYYNPIESKFISPVQGYTKWENLEKIEYQGNLRDVENIFGFNLDSNTPKISLLEKLLAYPRGGKPITVDGAYNIRNGRATDDEYIKLSDLPDTHSFYSTERLEVLLDSWDIPLDLRNDSDEIIEDPLPLGPDYSSTTNLRYLECPRTQYKASDQFLSYGTKLFNWKIPFGTEIVRNSHNVFRPLNNNTTHGTVATYLDYKTEANVSSSSKRTLEDHEQLIADPLPSSIKEVYSYFDTFFPNYEDGTPFNYPALPEGVELVSNYFCATVGNIEEGFVVPGLPSTVKFISGYCSYLFYSKFRGGLRNVDNVILEPNLCHNVEIVKDWMVSTFRESGINLLHNPENILRSLPSLSPTGNSYNSYNEAFALSTAAEGKLASDNPENETVRVYSHTQNRNISISDILQYLPVLSGSNHHDAYYMAFNGEFNGVAEDLGVLANRPIHSIIEVNDQIFFERTETGTEGSITGRDLIDWWIALGNPDPGTPSDDFILDLMNSYLKSGELYFENKIVDKFNPSLQ